MSVSMADCLRLPSFQGAEIISGVEQLGHIVNDISVLEIPNEQQLNYISESFKAFEVCLTSFSGIEDNVKAQCEVIRSLADKGNVSLVLFYVGTVVKELHEDVISTAQSLSVPLILMPPERYDLSYRECVQEIWGLLEEEEKRKEESYKDIAVLLSKIPENNRSFAKLLKTISDLKMVSLMLSDVSFLNSMQSSYQDAVPVDYCTIMDIFSRNYTDSSDHMIVSEQEGHKLKVYRIKLTTHRFRYYYLYIIDSSDNLTHNDAKQLAELVELFSEVWGLSEEEISNQSILNALDENNVERLKTLCKKYDLNVTKPGTLLLIHLNTSESPEYNTVNARIQLKEKFSRIAKESNHYVLFNTYGKYFVMFIRDILEDAADAEFIDLILNALCECHSSITQVHASLREIRDILPMYDCYYNDMEKVLPKQQLYTLSDIFFACTCRRIYELNGPDKMVIDSILHKFDNLADADDLLDTLSTYYLDTDCQVNLTAEHLYIHRNTVKYRLKKAHALLQLTTAHTKSNSFMQTMLGYYRLKD